MPRRALAVILAAFSVVSCGSAITSDELGAAVEPLTSAHDELQDFRLRIESGLTYGDILEGWPDVSASARGAIERFDIPENLPEADQLEIFAYAESLAVAHDQMLRVVEAVREYIRDDRPEENIASEFEGLPRVLDRLEDARDQALNPGEG